MRLNFFGFAVAMAGCLYLVGCTGTNGTRHTSNQDAAWHAEFLKTHLISIEPHDDGVLVYGPAFLTASSEPVVVQPGHTMVRQGDHGQVTYTISSLTDHGVVFTYRSTFAHHSFGKELFEVDEGSFELEWVSAASGDQNSR